MQYWSPMLSMVVAAIVMVMALQSVTCGQTTQPVGRALANADASPAARAQYAWLAELPQRHARRMLVGQNVNWGERARPQYEEFVQAMADQTGGRLAPSVLGADYAWDRVEAENIRLSNEVLKRHWKQGGLVTISMHPENPFVDGGGVRKRTGDDLRLLTRPGSAAYDRWRRDLRLVADGLAELRDAGVVVMFRPLHESNGDWFWWCDNGAADRPAQFTALWRDLFDYCTRERKLDNLLWVYAANVEASEKLRPTDYNYPGAAYVDIVGMDVYADRLDGETVNRNGSYDRLMALGKPFAVAEVGPRKTKGSFDAMAVLRAVRQHMPASVYTLWWHSWGSGITRSKMTLVENPNWQQILEDDWVVNLKQAAGRESLDNPIRARR